jgi:hypothetical protein
MKKFKSSKKVYSRRFTTDAHASAYYSLIPNVGYRYFKGGKTFKFASEMTFPKGHMIKRVKSNKRGFELSATYIPRSTARRVKLSSKRLRLSSRRLRR